MVEKLQVDDMALSSGLTVVVHESIDSTNRWCLDQCKAGVTLPFACFAEAQESGRGRRGKQWYATPYSNIVMSLAWPFVLARVPLHLLSITVSLAVVDVLQKAGLGNVQIKWPNDVYVNDKKIAGVLIETRPLAKGGSGTADIVTVIGVGLNYDMSSYEYELADKLMVFTDICAQAEEQALGERPARNVIASALLQSVVDACSVFEDTAVINLQRFREQYDYCRDKMIDIILEDQQVLTGVALGVNEDAELLVNVDGRQRVFNSADISIKTAGVVAE